MNSETIQQDGDGIQITAGVASSNAAIPAKSNTDAPRRILVSVESGAIADDVVVRVGVGAGLTVTVANGVRINQGKREILFCGGQDRIAVIRAGAADADVNVTPLSD